MQHKITFSEACTLVALRTGMAKRDVDEFLRALFAAMSEGLEAGESIRLKGIGSFKLVTTEERKSVDVNTGNAITLPARAKLNFIPAKELAMAVNAPFSAFEAVELAEGLTEEVLNASAESMQSNEENTSNENNDSFKTLPDTSADEIVNGVAPLAPFVKDSSDNIYVETDDEIKTEQENSVVLQELPTEKSDLNAYEIKQANKELAVETDEDSGGNSDIESVISSNVEHDDDSTAGSEFDRDIKQDIDTDISQPEIDNNNVQLRHNQWHHHQRRRRIGFFIGFVCALLLVCVASLLILLFCPNTVNLFRTMLSGKENIVIEKIDVSPTPISTNLHNNVIVATTDTTVKAETVKQNDPAPTEPSDKKIIYDIVSETRYLSTIARQHYGNQHFWPYIYEENQNILGHPNRIVPGTKVVVPPLSKFGVNPGNKADIAVAKQKEIEIYSRFNTNNKSNVSKRLKTKK